MNDFWEWRSSSREFEGSHEGTGGDKVHDRTRGGKIGLIVGVALFVVLAVIFAIFEYAQ
ncbi:hypothetical protein [Nitrobacter winogradskyi]|uniref:Uncharacterized protein n=2 Tax=Nitrobacter winogradskyi TaxID=913 RepID=A0ACC6ADK6_NITWI|nr:hypothetical protein [Nitrobacter winogradskyi]MCP1997893.1 hypothetical protein [Nitrobacter winogradskyi]GEC17182.1 hypothetical protein NWI01_30740 [Nitrobacter winogradskyi]